MPDWVPDFLKARKAVPESLRGMGAPWMTVTQKGTARVDPLEWQLSGMGQFVVALRGCATLVAWSGESVTNTGCLLGDQFQFFLFADMAYPSFQSWGHSNLQYLNLYEGVVAWIPYGWYVGSVAREGASGHSTVLQVPFVTMQLASQCRIWSQVAHVIAQWIQALMRQGSKAWSANGDSSLAWLNQPVPPAMPHSRARIDDGSPHDDDEERSRARSGRSRWRTGRITMPESSPLPNQVGDIVFVPVAGGCRTRIWGVVCGSLPSPIRRPRAAPERGSSHGPRRDP